MTPWRTKPGAHAEKPGAENSVEIRPWCGLDYYELAGL